MKEVEKKDAPDVSGGIVDGCIPVPSIDYPPWPGGPIVEPPFPPPSPEEPLA